MPPRSIVFCTLRAMFKFVILNQDMIFHVRLGLRVIGSLIKFLNTNL